MTNEQKYKTPEERNHAFNELCFSRDCESCKLRSHNSFGGVGCLKETMVDAVAEYKNNSCFRNVKCGEIKRCDTCKVMKWRKALKGACND